MAWNSPYSSNANPGIRRSGANTLAMQRTANQLQQNQNQISANTTAGTDRYGNPLQGAPQASPEAKLDQTRQDIYGAWQKQLGIPAEPKFAQLTGQMQQRASGANAPYSPQNIASQIGSQTDAINRQLQQQNLGANRAMDQAGIGGGLRVAGQAERGSVAGADTRRARMDIQSKSDLANFNQQAQGQRDLASWLQQEMSLRQGATGGLTSAKAQEEAFLQTPGGGGGGGSDPWGQGGSRPQGPQQFSYVRYPEKKQWEPDNFEPGIWSNYNMTRDQYIDYLKRHGHSSSDVPEGVPKGENA